MCDNKYIKRGYRIGFNTNFKIFKSLFVVHNESVNVWSHICGVFLFLALVAYTLLNLAPPGIYNTKPENFAYKWLGNGFYAPHPSTFML